MSQKRRKYNSPDPDPEFKKYWMAFVDSVANRENFNEGYLFQLEILCNLYKEQKRLTDLLDMQGYTYSTDGGRHGPQLKHYPEVSQLSNVRDKIVTYSRLLGITLVKDTAPSRAPEADEWNEV